MIYMLDVMKSAHSIYCDNKFIKIINSTKNNAPIMRYTVARGLNGQSDRPLGNHRPITTKIIITMINIRNIQFVISIETTGFLFSFIKIDNHMFFNPNLPRSHHQILHQRFHPSLTPHHQIHRYLS